MLGSVRKSTGPVLDAREGAALISAVAQGPVVSCGQQRLSLLLRGFQSLRTISAMMKLINVIKATFAT